MNQTNRSTLEKTLAKRINSTKGKTQKPGYLKELIIKLYPEISAALTRGCDYSEIAKSMTTDEIKVSASTLKKYHNQNRTDKSQNHREKLTQLQSVKSAEPKKLENREILSKDSDDLSRNFNHW